MSQRVYSKTFIASSHTVGAAALSYSVPVGFVAVIRSIDIVQLDPTKASVGFVGFSLTGSSNVQLFDRDLPTGAATTRISLHWDGRVAIENPGNISATTTGTAGAINYYTVAGYLLAI